jgi:arylsulfatase
MHHATLRIMGDDIGWFNIGAYHRGIMSGKTPNLDKLASQGMLFSEKLFKHSCYQSLARKRSTDVPPPDVDRDNELTLIPL